MKNRLSAMALVTVALFFGAGCGKDDKSSAERDAEIKKTIQEGAAKEQKMYEGMQKGMEQMEKGMEEHQEKAKK